MRQVLGRWQVLYEKRYIDRVLGWQPKVLSAIHQSHLYRCLGPHFPHPRVLRYQEGEGQAQQIDQSQDIWDLLRWLDRR